MQQSIIFKNVEYSRILGAILPVYTRRVSHSGGGGKGGGGGAKERGAPSPHPTIFQKITLEKDGRNSTRT